MKLEKYYENPQVLHVGTQENRAYYIPYKNSMGDCTIMLSGNDWNFKWYDQILDVPEVFSEGILENADTIPVPSCINMLGYDKHQYANVRGPIPFDPPYAPLENPCGAYVKKFNIEDLGQQYYLNFEGVDSCFYLWVNGVFVGYSQVSHSTSEFDITKFVKTGENVMSVLVLKWCDGTYFEDQDKLRMTGIFRDVYILKRPTEIIRDFTIQTLLGAKAELKIELEKNSKKEITFELIDPMGNFVQSWTSCDDVTTTSVEQPMMWNAETPYLYKLVMKSDEESIEQQVGFRKVEIVGSVLKVNGQNIKLKGVNRHDSNAYTGYTISKEQLIEDLKLMKTHNVNAIRTSHYPNAPWAYELYSQYGFYIMDEADLETHNTEMIYAGGRVNYNYEDEIILNTSFGMLCSDPTYEKTVLDRIQRCVIRDKNQPCVIMWSLGNESGYGINMEKAAQWIKDYNKDFLVHYESSIYQMPDHENDLSNIDVYSRMYMPVKESAMYCEKNPAKPLVLCEYSHSMGNSPGDLEDYFELVYRYENFAGTFVWEWCDHSVYSGKTADGKEKFLYGGDFGEFPVEGNFCLDGLVYPNRTPHTGLIEYRNVARPIRASYKNGAIALSNMMDFEDIKDYVTISWSLYLNHEIAKQGMLEGTSIKPHETVSVQLPVDVKATADEEPYVLLEYVTKKDTPLLSSGTIIGFDQLFLAEEKKDCCHTCAETLESNEMTYSETDHVITVEGNGFRYVFDKFKGVLSECTSNNINYMKEPMQYNIWRAPTDNDRKIVAEWIKAGYDRKTIRVYSSNVARVEDKLVVCFELGMGSQYLQNIMRMNAKFIVSNDGTIEIVIDAAKDPVFPYLPRFGVRLFLDEKFDNVEYIGYGPYESYVDKRRASYYGKFESTVDGLHEDYIRPQENGSHWGCNCLSVDSGDAVLKVSGNKFSFNASHYSQEELRRKAHNFELQKSDATILCLDSHMSGIGSGSCGPFLMDEYRVLENELQFNMKLSFLKK